MIMVYQPCSAWPIMDLDLKYIDKMNDRQGICHVNSTDLAWLFKEWIWTTGMNVLYIYLDGFVAIAKWMWGTVVRWLRLGGWGSEVFGLGWNSTSLTKVEWYFSPIPKVHCSFNTNHWEIQLTINLSSVRNILIHSLDTLEVEVQLQDFFRFNKKPRFNKFYHFYYLFF